jgi:hypothetical protein
MRWAGRRRILPGLGFLKYDRFYGDKDATVLRRGKLAQSMRSENVKVTGTREWRRAEMCTLLCDRGFCPCNLPRIVSLRTRTCQRVATSFMRWCRYSDEYMCARQHGAASVAQMRPEHYVKWEVR